MSKEKNMYTPGELCNMYPQLTLTPQMITMLLRNDILEGVITKREVLITLTSWRDLMIHRNTILDKKKS